jgi:hypothetical protein
MEYYFPTYKKPKTVTGNLRRHPTQVNLRTLRKNNCFPIGKSASLTKIAMKPNFDIELLPQAIEFLETLDDKTREKINTISRKPNLSATMSFLKS